MDTPEIFTPYIQFGFAGFAFLLVGVIVWMIRELLKVLKETNKVISANTEVSKQAVEAGAQELNLMRDIHAKLISRPCIASKEQ